MRSIRTSETMVGAAAAQRLRLVDGGRGCSADRVPSLGDFYRSDGPDLFGKCAVFARTMARLQQRQLAQSFDRVTLTSGLANRVTVEDPYGEGEREMICFDSNSYLQLHRHPRVVAAVQQALGRVGYGTASAQLLCGTNRELRRLEQTLSRFHGREDAVVFSSGYAANLGAITGLLREHDVVIRDRFSHASIHDACRYSEAGHRWSYPHNDMHALSAQLQRAKPLLGRGGCLIVTDGVFSMHGDLAPLPELVTLARRHGARVMVDDAHGTGVLGATGRGVEEHFGLEGAADLLMGTFSKAPGTVGGYVVGSREVVSYLRYFARSAMFTAALPAALCAGIAEAFRVMEQEPEHRQRLWRNVRRLARGLRDVGLTVPEPRSPIIALVIGSETRLLRFARELFVGGVKAGTVTYPAVPAGASLVRLSVNASHTDDDLDRTVEVLQRLGRRYDLIERTPDEVTAIREERLAAIGAR